MENNKTKFNLTISEYLVKELKIKAIEQGLTTSEYINWIILKEFNREEDERQRIKKENKK